MSAVTDSQAPGLEADLDKIRELLDKARAALPADAYASAIVNVHCPSATEVDIAAREWGVRAHWTDDRRQYVAEAGNWQIQLTAVYVPRLTAVAA